MTWGIFSASQQLEQIGTFGASTYPIGDIHLLHGCAPELMEPSLAPCPIVRLAAGELLIDSSRASLYIVLRGVLGVLADSASAMADGTVIRILPGESVGEQSVLEDSPNLTSISAIDDTELLVIDAELVWQLIDQCSSLARNLLRLLSFRVRAANALLRRRKQIGEFYRQMSMNDGLTGLYNRIWLGDMLPKMVAKAHRGDSALALVMIDLDHFKQFNDTHGHLIGDDALRASAEVISAALRPSDFAVRFGGEEMMVLLPDATAPLAVLVAERLCMRMREARVFADMRVPMPHMTASFGVAVLGPGMSEQDLMAAADAALYRAKNSGRNRVSL